MGNWRYIASRLNGDGTETFLSYDVPLSGGQTTTALSGPGGINGTITPEIAALQDEYGRPILEPWSTAIYAEVDGQIRGGAILSGFEEKGPDLALDCVSFAGYPGGMPYTGRDSHTSIDPLDVVRNLWAHLQQAARGNIGMEIGEGSTQIRIGKPDSPEYAAAAAADFAKLFNAVLGPRHRHGSAQTPRASNVVRSAAGLVFEDLMLRQSGR